MELEFIQLLLIYGIVLGIPLGWFLRGMTWQVIEKIQEVKASK